MFIASELEREGPVSLLGTFFPSEFTAERTQEAILQKLNESLFSIYNALRQHEPSLIFVPCAYVPSPYWFATYTDLLNAVIADDVHGALTSINTLGSIPDETVPPLMSWDNLEQPARQAYGTIFSSDPTTRVALNNPSHENVSAARKAIEDALTCLGQAAPDIVSELRCLTKQIVLVAGKVNEVEEFDGATVFGIWGAIFLNAERHRSRCDAIGGLVHECAHAVLLGRAMGQALVLNDPDELFSSPLRSDLRPLDGIFHATFVLARMHYAFQKVLMSGLLQAEEIEDVQAKMLGCRSAFFSGYKTLSEHARLTDLGAALICSAENYMTAPK